MIRWLSFLCFLVLLPLTCFSQASAQQNDANKMMKPVKFGALALLTGDFAFSGQLCRGGMELAKDDVNASGGIRGRPLEILFEDFGPFDLKKAAAGGQKLLTIDRVDALFPAVAEDAEMLGPIALRSRVPLMASGPGGVNIGRYGANVFRATTTDLVLLQTYFDHVKKRGLTHVSLFGAENSYFENIAQSAEKEAPKHGVTLKITRVPQDEFDFKTHAARLKKDGTQAIISLLMPQQFIPFLRALNSVGNKVPVLGAPYYDYEAVKKEAFADGGELLLVRYALPGPEFAKRYFERYNKVPVRPAGNCYDAIRVMAKVLADTNLDYDLTNAALRSLKNYQGVTGEFSIGADGDRYGEKAELLKLIGQDWVPVS